MRTEKKRTKKDTPYAMDRILIILGISLAIITAAMIVLFCIYQTTPDTLIGCVFAAITGECGIMGWIKNSKERQETRRWELENRQYYRAQMRERTIEDE